MKLRLKLAASAFAIATFAAVAAQASLLLDVPAPTGALPTDTALTYTFDAAAGPGLLTFTLDGYGSLDAQNGYEDDFIISLNGLEILKGTFNLGGGGADFLYFAPLGATWSNGSGNGANVTWAGGQMVGTTSLDLAQGSNTLTFAYASLAGGDHAGFQGTGDEAWGLEQMTVTGGAAVPEPAAWMAMILGFGAIGSVLRRLRALSATIA